MADEQELLQPKRIDLATFSIEHEMPAISHYCNHMIVQGDPECMYVTFFQIRPPLILDAEQPIDVSKAVTARPVASVAIDRAKIQVFIDVLQKQADIWKAEDNATA